jgi:hypothetical protein
MVNICSLALTFTVNACMGRFTFTFVAVPRPDTRAMILTRIAVTHVFVGLCHNGEGEGVYSILVRYPRKFNGFYGSTPAPPFPLTPRLLSPLPI